MQRANAALPSLMARVAMLPALFRYLTGSRNWLACVSRRRRARRATGL